MDNLLEKIKENRIIVAVVVVVVLFVIAVVLVILDRTGSEEEVYTLPIESEENTDYRWNNVTIESGATKPSVTEMPVYWAGVYSVSEVETVVEEFGFGGAEKEVTADGTFHSWISGDEFTRYNRRQLEMALQLGSN